MKFGKHLLKAVSNLTVWKMTCILLAFLLGLALVASSGQPELAKGFIRGRDQGNLLAATAQLTHAANKSGPAFDLSSAQETILQSKEVIRLRSASSPILNYIDPVLTGLAHYQIAFAKNDLAGAKSVLLSEIAPANKVLATSLADLNRKMDDEIQSKGKVRDLVQKIFFVTSLLGLLSMISLFGQWINRDLDNWKLEILQSKMHYPYNSVILNYFIKKNGLEDNKVERERLAFFHFLPIFTPNIEALSKDREGFLVGNQDLTQELAGAEAFAYYLSNEKSIFQKPPQGACALAIDHHLLSHALVHWMDEIRKDQKIELFTAESEWDGKDWIVNLHTSGEPVHESIYNGYRQVMEKKAGVDKKNSGSLDFVRAALRKACTKFAVTHENGNLNLVMTFTSQ